MTESKTRASLASRLRKKQDVRSKKRLESEAAPSGKKAQDVRSKKRERSESEAAPTCKRARRSDAKPPPPGYACRACGRADHWIYECPQFVARAKPPAEEKADCAEDEKRVTCKCGKPAKKRRVFSADKGPSERWICAKKACDLNAAVKKRTKPNKRYVERAARRNEKKKLFVSGLPFKGNTAAHLKAFFEKHGAEGPKRVIPLYAGDDKHAFCGQAYCVFESADDAAAALALSGEKLGDRWLALSAVTPVKKKGRSSTSQVVS